MQPRGASLEDFQGLPCNDTHIDRYVRNTRRKPRSDGEYVAWGMLYSAAEHGAYRTQRTTALSFVSPELAHFITVTRSRAATVQLYLCQTRARPSTTTGFIHGQRAALGCTTTRKPAGYPTNATVLRKQNTRYTQDIAYSSKVSAGLH